MYINLLDVCTNVRTGKTVDMHLAIFGPVAILSVIAIRRRSRKDEELPVGGGGADESRRGGG